MIPMSMLSHQDGEIIIVEDGARAVRKVFLRGELHDHTPLSEWAFEIANAQRERASLAERHLCQMIDEWRDREGDPYTREVMERQNKERAAIGLGPVIIDEEEWTARILPPSFAEREEQKS